jgi:hypothetical protein
MRNYVVAASFVFVMSQLIPVFAQQPGRTGAPGPRPEGRPAARQPVVAPPLFVREDFQREPNAQGQVAIVPANLTNANLELKVYGPDAKNLTISGAAGTATPINLWTGMSTGPLVVTLRDKTRMVDLSGLARIHWVTRASAFHVVRPVVKLADGTFLVGDHADSSTTTFLPSEFTLYDLRWVKLDPERAVTTGVYGPVGDAASWIEHPDLSKVDEVGFADLMPSSGHGSGGWVNVANIEIYGKPVSR